jgi:hypothetical protein
MATPNLEEYRDIARQCRGTTECAAILGLVRWIEKLETLIINSTNAMEWAAERLEIDDGMTDGEQKTTASYLREVLGKEIP